MPIEEVESIAKEFGQIYQKFGQSPKQGNYLFQSIAKKAKLNDIMSKDIDDARRWFRDEAKSVASINQQKMVDSSGPFEKMTNLSENSIGKMYFFFYDAKTKDKLPYWDKFPLIFPIEYYSNGSMLGINLHYLPPVARAQLMDALYTTLNNEKMNKTTKLQISYQILKSASKFKYFKPCIKKYLFNHVKSPFIIVNTQFWDYAMMLPSAQWQKASESKVWKDSMDKIGN